MSNVKSMGNLDKAERMLRQCPHGIKAADFMRKMGFLSRQTAYNYLNSLELKGKAYNEHGLWFPKEVGISEEPSKRKLDHLVEEAFRSLKEKNDTFTLEQVASEVGLPPSNIRASVYRLVKKHGWQTEKTDRGVVIRTYKHETVIFVTEIPK